MELLCRDNRLGSHTWKWKEELEDQIWQTLINQRAIRRTFRARIGVPQGAGTNAGPPLAINSGGDVLPLTFVVGAALEGGGGELLLLLSGLLLFGRSVSKLRSARLPLCHGGCC